MILKNAEVMNSDFHLVRCDLQIKDTKIAKIGQSLTDDEVLDVSGKMILPGFIDTHIHGAFGVRISDEHPDLSKVTEFEATQGVTSIAITTAASEFHHLLGQISLAARASHKAKGAKIAGIHAEGPFISKLYKGAMNADYILSPEVEKLNQMIEAGEGLLKMITIAPEHDGAEEFIRYAIKCGLTVSLGHTNATYQEAERAILAGATQATHTFNAMRALNHREPGVLGAVLTNDTVCCEMICDYVHLHPATVQLIYKLKGVDRINMISDSGHAAGLDVTEFMVDGLMRYVKDGVVRLADGTIAGSAKTLLDGVRNLVSSGIPVEEVSKMASYNPARALKIENQTGSIAAGKAADLVVFDENLELIYTFVDGKCVYKG